MSTSFSHGIERKKERKKRKYIYNYNYNNNCYKYYKYLTKRVTKTNHLDGSSSKNINDITLTIYSSKI